ncbi:MerC domain-containing protein [Brevundimonas sp. SORGH_AS_0993]|uniref:MerC domain-containing protein n=1 Tax=Brevundimonas sp. SORGH_AS_0993 TaxID=3041794 RepID=UPI00277D5D60|nr:MerC domain-containing protein [Brevundimonas sp. SORGH_AS_0993]MDQ1153399.1 hypothetical protein [Brevundimonas sp. SORGH_AS_0993]
MAIHRTGDAMGISLSGLCMVHCLALPLLVSLFPLAGAWAEAPWVHWVFAFMAGPLAAYVLSRPDTAGRRDWLLIAAGALGVALLFFAAAELPTHEAETPMTVAGGLILAGAHIVNWRKRNHAH